MRASNSLRIGLVGAAAANLFALSDLPYGFYQMLRLATTALAIWAVFELFETAKSYWLWLLGLIAVIYNPIYVIHMEREAHQVHNVATAIVLLTLAWRSRGSSERA